MHLGHLARMPQPPFLSGRRAEANSVPMTKTFNSHNRLIALVGEGQVNDLAKLPAEDELRRRRELRATQNKLDAPWLIGPAELAPPLEVLPGPLAGVVAMVQTVVRHLGMDGDTNSNGLQGSGIGATAANDWPSAGVADGDNTG